MTATQQETPGRRVSSCRNMLGLATPRSDCCESVPSPAHSPAVDTHRTSHSDQGETTTARDSNMGAALGRLGDESQSEEVNVNTEDPEVAAVADNTDTAHSSHCGSRQITFRSGRESRILSVQVSDVPHSDSSTDEIWDSDSGLFSEEQPRNTSGTVITNGICNEACEAEATQVPDNTLSNSNSSLAESAADIISLETDCSTYHSTNGIHSSDVSIALHVESENSEPVATSSSQCTHSNRQPLDARAASARWAGKLSPLMYAPPPYVAKPPPYAEGADRRTPTTISELYRAAPLAFEMPPSYDSAVSGRSQQRSTRGRGNQSMERTESRTPVSKCSGPRCGCYMLLIFVVFALLEIITSVVSSD